MNHLIPEWNFDAEIPNSNSNHKKPIGEENELVELLWQNGRVVLQNQAQRKPQQSEPQQFKTSLSYGNNSSSLIQDDETVSWFNSHIEDTDFCSDFSSWLPVESDKFAKTITDVSPHQLTVIPECRATFPEKTLDDMTMRYKKTGKESSVMTFGSSHCGSNQVRTDVIDFSRGSTGTRTTNVTRTTNDVSVEYSFKDDDVLKEFSNNEVGKTETVEPTLTSGGSGSSFGRDSTGISSHKRKKTDEDDSECQSEDVELESAAGTKQTRARPARRSRAAEVHNLSERRRRDRINKKMRALQELIPHCNKQTDKASMLDEAIEYLKSLQLQLQMFQVMRMGNEMAAAPMMFPGVQQYMSRMAMAMSQQTMLPYHNSMHLSRLPGQNIALQNQAAICQAARFQNHLQNTAFPEQYARYMAFQQMQHPSQGMSMFGYGNSQNAASHSGSASVTLPAASASAAHGDATFSKYTHYLLRRNQT